MTNQLSEKILKLKKEKNAIILAHLYQIPEIQEIADYVGDSYYLSQVARDAKEDLIIFCGVKFMAESAKVLSPEKTVILPAPNAGCPMADMAEVEDVEEMIKKYPDAFKVCYINSSYEVKALCDASVTSSSALNIIKNIPNKQILFLPDQNLGGYISEFFPEKEFIFWQGFCPTHERISVEDILTAKEKHPGAPVLIHPECKPECVELADYAGSTSGIIDYATNDQEHDEFIVVTEIGVIHEMEKRNPGKKFYPATDKLVCPNMKKNTLEKVRDCLKNNTNQVELDEEFMEKAKKPLERMHELAK